MNPDNNAINIYGKDLKTISEFIAKMVSNNKLTVPRRAIVPVERQDSLVTMVADNNGQGNIQNNGRNNEYRQQIEYGTTVWAARTTAFQKAKNDVRNADVDDIYAQIPRELKTGFLSVGFLAKDKKSGCYYLLTAAHFLRDLRPMEFNRSAPYNPLGALSLSSPCRVLQPALPPH